MIITISGMPGSGKSTVAKLLAKNLKFRHYSAGDFMRAMAEEMGLTLDELTQQAKSDRSIDDEIDKRTIELAEREDDFVLDSRLGWYFIPDSVKVLLLVDLDAAAQRIFAARRPDEKENTTLERTKENVSKRLRSEIQRYAKLYNVDYTDRKKYDLVVDTTQFTPDQIVQKIVDFLRASKILKDVA